MKINEARRILKENGYTISFGKRLRESYNYLKKKGFLVEDGSENDDLNDEETLEKEYKVSSKDELKEKFEKIVAKLKATGTLAECVKLLRQMSDDQARTLALGFGKGPLHSKVSVNQDDVKNCFNLKPTQNEIDFDKSLDVPLKKFDNFKDYLIGKDVAVWGKKIITYNNYIIDGHHRWSQVYVINPKATIQAINFKSLAGDNESGVDALKDFQGSILAYNMAKKGVKELPAGKAGTNLFKVIQNEKDCKEKLKKKIEEGGNGDKMVELMHKKFDDVTDLDGLIQKLFENCQSMADHNMPLKGAPDRIDMPQTDDETTEFAAKGMTDI